MTRSVDSNGPTGVAAHSPAHSAGRHGGCRQRPGTAKGVVFVTLEDETGTVQVIVWKALRERQRAALLQSRLLAVYGRWQRTGEGEHTVMHLIAQHLVNLTPLLGGLTSSSRDFH